MENGMAIDTLHSELLELSRDSRYSFDRFRCDWGRMNAPRYNELKAGFSRSLRELAKASPVKYCKGSGMFYMFNGKVYEQIPVSVVEQAYQVLMLDLGIGPMMYNASVRKDSFVSVIQSYNILRPSFSLVAFKNGIIDFASGLKNPRVMPFSPEYHVTYYHPYDFNQKARCDRFDNFINEVLPDKASREILQMFLGLGLIERGMAYNLYEGTASNKVELCLLLVGTGANGKSVLFDIACALFGNDKISKMDYAELTADGDEGMRGRYTTRNAIFNWSSDSDPRKFGKRNTGMFKRIVSGEPVPIRKLGQDISDPNNIPYLIFSLNELPLSDDSTLGFIRRLQYVSFDVTIPKDRQDPELAAKIIKSELSGVFNWVFEGSLKIKRRKFRFPSAEGSKLQMLKSLIVSKPILAWIRAYGMRGGAVTKGEIFVWFKSSDLYAYFTRFCKDNDVEDKNIPPIQKFGRDMWNAFGFERKKSSVGCVYKVFGALEADLKQQFLIGEVEEEKEEERKSFIQDDTDNGART